MYVWMDGWMDVWMYVCMYVCMLMICPCMSRIDITCFTYVDIHVFPAQNVRFALVEEPISAGWASTHSYPPEECRAGRTSGRSTWGVQRKTSNHQPK